MTKPFKPLLAATLENDTPTASLPYPLLGSPKLDGIRTLMVDEAEGVQGPVPATRKIKLLPNDKIRARLSRPELRGMDGELISGVVTHPDVYNSTMRIVMKGEGPDMNQAVWLYTDAKGKPKMSFEPIEGGLRIDGSAFYVFDDFTDPDLPFEHRFANLQRRVAALPDDLKPFVRVVDHPVIETAIELGTYERVFVEQGFEGMMLRHRHGRYKFGRSTENEMILAKVKRFADTDGIIIGFEEMMHNDNEAEKDALGNTKRSSHAENLRPAGTLGAILCRLPEFGDQVVKCGSGYSAALKQQIWDNRADWMGSTVVLKYQPSGMKDLPRFPVFKGRRQD